MPLLNNVSTLVTPPPPDVQDEATPLRTIDDAVLVWIDDTIEWVGPAADCPSEYEDEPMHDAEGALVVPGLIDCHTHLAFGGWRADEFEMRLQGRSYLEIAAGGGIASTMQETQEASVDALYDRCRGFLDAMAGLKWIRAYGGGRTQAAPRVPAAAGRSAPGDRAHASRRPHRPAGV